MNPPRAVPPNYFPERTARLFAMLVTAASAAFLYARLESLHDHMVEFGIAGVFLIAWIVAVLPRIWRQRNGWCSR